MVVLERVPLKSHSVSRLGWACRNRWPCAPYVCRFQILFPSLIQTSRLSLLTTSFITASATGFLVIHKSVRWRWNQAQPIQPTRIILMMMKITNLGAGVNFATVLKKEVEAQRSSIVESWWKESSIHRSRRKCSWRR